MSKVERAIIMAAGFGSRMEPVTNEIPKPLVKVNGRAMIESIIQALKENGIDEIYIVVGYKKDKFAFLEKKYPGLKLIENPWYAHSNNISSIYAARDHLENCVICEGDLLIDNPKILSLPIEGSGYASLYVDHPTHEWVFAENNHHITGCSKTGAPSGWQFYGISRWSEEDGKQLKKDLETEFEERKNTNIFWDEVALFCHPEHYDLRLYPLQEGDLREIDSLDELIALDPSYTHLKDSQK